MNSSNPDFIALPKLLSQGRSASFPVAVGDEGSRSWEDFLRAAAKWRARFRQAPETRWALYCKDNWSFIGALFGAWSAGKVVHLPGDNTPESVQRLLSEVDGFIGDFEGASLKRLPDLSGKEIPEDPREALDPEAESLVLYTSGSSGRPVAIPKKLRQLAREIENLESTFGSRLGKAEVLATVSQQHIYGLLFKILWPLCAGRVIRLRQLFYPEEILEAVASSSAACLVASPAHLKRLPEAAAWTAAGERWRAVFSSGGPLGWSAAQDAQRHFGHAVTEIYGSSETGGVAWRDRSQDDSAWTCFPGVKVSVLAEQLCIESPLLPDARPFQSADRAEALASRTFRLLGREDRIVKVEEKRISLDAIENSLLESGLALEAKALSLEGERLEIGAVLVLSVEGQKRLQGEGRAALRLALREAVARRVERVGLPRRFRYVDAMPLNAQAKTSLATLEALFAERQE
jgi:acyl-coenzyme A synthetase/AMP-(fatty) acid ligase